MEVRLLPRSDVILNLLLAPSRLVTVGLLQGTRWWCCQTSSGVPMPVSAGKKSRGCRVPLPSLSRESGFHRQEIHQRNRCVRGPPEGSEGGCCRSAVQGPSPGLMGHV